MRLCFFGSYSCVPGGTLSVLEGHTNSTSISAEAMASSRFRTMGWVEGLVMPPLPFGLVRYRSLIVGSIHVEHDVSGCQCKHGFSDSNALTASTDVLPEELHWPLCTYWRLGWCRMLQVSLSLQHCGCYPVGVGRYLMLCHTQYIRSLAWIGQWPCTASGECVCLRPILSVRPPGWGWGVNTSMVFSCQPLNMSLMSRRWT